MPPRTTCIADVKIASGREAAFFFDKPVALKDRIVTLDVLRGFALLGILVANVDTFAGPEGMHSVPLELTKIPLAGEHIHLDLAIMTIKWMFVEGKMRAMFAMLFGAGAVLLTERLERGRQPAATADIFLRRNMWLALFGLVHGTLIWQGDILLDYGLLALLFLFPLRHVRPHRLVGVGLTIWLVGATLGFVNVSDAVPRIRQGEILLEATRAQEAGGHLNLEQQAILAAEVEARTKREAAMAQAVQDGREGLLEGIPSRTKKYLATSATIFTSGIFTEMLGAMIVGMGLYKFGFLSGLWSTRAYLVTATVGYVISLPIVLVGIWNMSRLGFTSAALLRWMGLPYELETAPGMLANASVLLVLVRKGWLKPILDRLGAVGRTAFSNYILTSIICQFVFVWSPWKLYGRLDYAQHLYIVAAVWTINLTVSALWLRVFAFGPLEWVWRSLTYWKRPQFRVL